MKNLLLSLVLFISGLSALSQGVAVNNNGTPANNNAMLDVDATTNDKGILIPRVSSGQRTGIAGLGATDEGLTVYDETTNSYWLWDGTQWLQFMMQGDAWSLSGNAGTTPGTDFIGTTDAQDWVIKTNNNERIRVYSNGRAEFIGTTDASGNVNSGVIEVGNSLRIDGNEMITNNNTTLFLQNDNDGDLSIDQGSLFVDASTNRIGINTTGPTTTLDVNGTVRIRGGAPQEGAVLMSTDANGNATWATAGYGLVPIGSIVAWHGNMGGVPTLPDGWVECNGGTVSDAASPMNGQAIPNLNASTTSSSGDASRGRFLRGHTTSGLFQNDQTNNLSQIEVDDDDGGCQCNRTLDDAGNWTGWIGSKRADDRLRFRHSGVENRVTNMSVIWIIRIK